MTINFISTSKTNKNTLKTTIFREVILQTIYFYIIVKILDNTYFVQYPQNFKLYYNTN